MTVLTFTTFNGFVFEWTCEIVESKEPDLAPVHHERVTMTGAVTKVVHEGADHDKAKSIFEKEEAAYKQRAETEAIVGGNG